MEKTEDRSGKMTENSHNGSVKYGKSIPVPVDLTGEKQLTK